MNFIFEGLKNISPQKKSFKAFQAVVLVELLVQGAGIHRLHLNLQVDTHNLQVGSHYSEIYHFYSLVIPFMVKVFWEGEMAAEFALVVDNLA